VDLWGAVAIGLVAGVICPLACSLKWRLRLDDSLDVVAIHLGGGLVGTLMVGLFATRAVNSTGLPADGLVYGGGFTQLGRRAIAVGAVGLYPFVVTLVIGYLITVTIGFRVRPESEAGGLDLNEHAETGYELGLGTGSGRGEDTGPPPPRTGNGARERDPPPAALRL
jgi:Amt family ammonium transporter